MKNRFLQIASITFLAIFIAGTIVWEKQEGMQVKAVAPDVFRIIDGDTVYFEGKKARLLGFDAAEMAFGGGGTGLPTRFNGDQEPWASEGRDKLRQLIDYSETLEVAIAKQNDKYKRSLIHIYVNGVPVAVPMIEAGLAYETISRYGDNGFPKEAGMILKAASKSEMPKFENPHVWRRTHSKIARPD